MIVTVTNADDEYNQSGVRDLSSESRILVVVGSAEPRFYKIDAGADAYGTASKFEKDHGMCMGTDQARGME